jgi:HK97 gp10 family phage protein
MTKMVIDSSQIHAIVADPAVRDELLRVGEDVARESAIRAPKRTGAGAASIRPEAVLDGDSWEVQVSWDREHYYMYFHQVGTRYMPPHPFMAETGTGAL